MPDEFRRRADGCRRLAAAPRNANDRTFWLGLLERWPIFTKWSPYDARSRSLDAPPMRETEAPHTGPSRGVLGRHLAWRSWHKRKAEIRLTRWP
jgi:hypothetical protein